MQKIIVRYRYALSCLMSSLASVLGLVNPILAGVLVGRALRVFSMPVIAPVVSGMLAVKAARMLLRTAASRITGGGIRSPILWLQRKIGRWLWWVEPLLHSWGIAGLALQRRLGLFHLIRLPPRRVSAGSDTGMKIASALTFSLLDTLVTTASGLLFYLTRNYAASFLAALLPAFGAAPWFAEKTKRLSRTRKRTRAAADTAAGSAPRNGRNDK